MTDSLEEWRRLRADFTTQASAYHDLSLRVAMLRTEDRVSEVRVRHPHHAVMLWQFFGGGDELLAAAKSLTGAPQELKFGMGGAQLTALGVLEGSGVELFKRMAYRAGSLLPEETRLRLMTEVMDEVNAHFPVSGKPSFSMNHDPLATWLAFVLSNVRTLAPLRTPEGGVLRVDPFTASSRAIDELLASHATPQRTGKGGVLDHSFAAALSFPGEQRATVSAVASALRDAGVDTFYDEWFQAELAVPNLDLVLQQIYDRAGLIVVFLCEAYDRKEWCGVEWRVIRDLLKRKQDDRIMYFRMDDGHVAGLLSIDGYINARNRTPTEIAQLIQRRL